MKTIEQNLTLTDNGDCTISLNGVQIADTADLPTLWIERRNLASDIVTAYNEHAALCAVADAAAKLWKEQTNGCFDSARTASIDMSKKLEALAAIRGGGK